MKRAKEKAQETQIDTFTRIHTQEIPYKLKTIIYAKDHKVKKYSDKAS